MISDRIKNSVMVDVKFLRKQNTITNIYAKRWYSAVTNLIGVSDLRARAGKFDTPWQAKSNPLYSPPEWKYVDYRLSDLYDRRAIEMLEKSKELNKPIYTMWSGGIDSTSVLASYIKNWSTQDLGNLVVVMNTNSMIENFEFYSKFISGKIKCYHYSELNVDEEFLAKNLLTHGDPADCLFGPSSPAYKELIADGRHNEDYKKHLPAIIAGTKHTITESLQAPGTVEWWVNKVVENLEEMRPENVTSVSDWWWWTYANFKWEFSCQRPLFFGRKNLGQPIDQTLLKEYSENIFFNTDYFQQWSYSNLKYLLANGQKDHKREAKNYIFELDGNQDYRENKTKLPGAPANLFERYNQDLPMLYDSAWKGSYYDPKLNEEFIDALEEYQG